MVGQSRYIGIQEMESAIISHPTNIDSLPPGSSCQPTINYVEIDKLINYICRSVVSLLETDDNNDTLGRVLREQASRDLLSHFITDPQVRSLLVRRYSRKEEDEEESEAVVDTTDPNQTSMDCDCVYEITGDIQFGNSRAASVVFVKQTPCVEADKHMSRQIRVLTLSDKEPYQTLQETGMYERDYGKVDPDLEKRIVEIEMGMLHLHQNTHVPTVTMPVSPIATPTMNRCQEPENRIATVNDSDDKLEDSSFSNQLQNEVNRWVREIQRVTKFERDPSSGTALQDISFWLNLERALLRIQERLESPGLRLTKSTLQANIGIVVDVICECFKIKHVQLSILALQLLKSFIEKDMINAKSLQQITDTLNKIEFTCTEPELVEEGYHQAVRVCGAIVKCQGSQSILTNGSVSEIVIFCSRVNSSKLVKWLRDKAARTLISITRCLFRRLPDFPEDSYLKPSYQIRIRLGGATSQSTNAFKELAENDTAASLASQSPPSASSIPSSSTLRIITEKNQPYNLAFINDYFCYLGSLINPNLKTELTKFDEDKILLGLRMLRAAINEAACNIGQKSSLIFTTRNNICHNIVSILKTSRSMLLIGGALDLAVDIFIKLRYHLKYQFEAFLEQLMEMLAANTDISQETHSSSFIATNGTVLRSEELRSYVLNAVLELFMNIEHLSHELYYNYDCDPYSSDIYENLVQICSKNCFQHSLGTHFTPTQLTSFKCLLTNLADIYFVEIGVNKCLKLNTDLNLSSLACFKGNDINKKLKARFPRTFRDVNEAKKRKRLLWLALEKFNARPKDGIQFIKDNKLIDNNEDLVQFLKDNLRVDKKVLGEFLSKEENKPMRETFIRSLDFTNLRIDEALRSMLEKFRLPGESQLIERILDAFSIHWFEQNKNILHSSDNALSLAYAIIMLNVDQHSKKVKPMTCDEFDRNLMGPKSERIYDRKLLDQIYTNIRDNEIVLPDEQVGYVRQRYLWKCTMAKSERIDAIYWITGEPTNNNSAHVQSHPYSPYQPSQISDTHQEPTKIPDATVVVMSEPTGNDDDVTQIRELTLIDMNKILFDIMWSPTVAALSFIFDKIDTSLYPELSRQIVDHGFNRFAHLCTNHGHLDNLVVSLCKFTTDLSPIPHNHSGQRHLLSDKNSLAALSLLTIIRDYANYMRDSWSNIVRNLLQWYCSKCIDDVVQVDDFALQRKLSLRMREIKKSPSTMNQQNSTFLRSVYTYFAGQQPTTEGKVQNGANCAPSAIQVLIQTIQDAEYCQESLVELIMAFSTTNIDGDPEEVEDAEVFKLEIFTQVILNNKDQASAIWPRIRAYFARQSSICGRSSWLGERIISAAFRVAIQFKPKPEVFSLLGHIVATLDADIVRGDHTFTALMTLTELHSPNVSLNAKELEACFNQVIFPFLDKVLDGCDPIQMDRTLNRAINLLSKIFLKHHKLLKELETFALLWYAILDTMEKYIKTNSALKEATFELVKNMVLVMDNEQCMSVEMKDITRTKFMFWEFQSGSDY